MKVELLFRAAADPTRLRVLHLLLEGELCVGDLVTLLGQPQPTASRHLAYLRRAGLVRARKAGLWSFYALAAPRRPAHERVLECVRACAADVPQLRKDRAARKALLRNGSCCPAVRSR
jgi:ArsR family transcriptional regulator